MADEFETADETVISRRKSDPVDDRTVVSRRKNESKASDAVDATEANDATIISTRKTPPVDDATVISVRRNKADSLNDDTVIVGASVGDDATVIVDDTVIVGTPANNDETVIVNPRSTVLPDNDDTVIVLPTSPGPAGGASVVTEDDADATVIAGGRSPVAPGGIVGQPMGLIPESEREVEVIERTDFGTPPPRAPRSTDPAAVYERTMKKSQRRARTVALLLLASAVVIGVVIAVVIVMLLRG